MGGGSRAAVVIAAMLASPAISSSPSLAALVPIRVRVGRLVRTALAFLSCSDGCGRLLIGAAMVVMQAAPDKGVQQNGRGGREIDYCLHGDFMIGAAITLVNPVSRIKGPGKRTVSVPKCQGPTSRQTPPCP